MDPALTVRAGRTAAMVMLLGGDGVATTPEGTRLVASLDLSSGIELAQIARRESPAAAQRIRLRKACIRAWMEEFAGIASPLANNIVVPGAGLAPLALDWCSQHVQARAIELDHENVSAKRSLIGLCADAAIANRIQCLDCDLRDIVATEQALRTGGWHSQESALWIIEGLSYYISHDQLVSLIRLALGGNRTNRVIMEFSGPRDALNPAARAETETYHQFLGKLLGGRDLTITDIDRVTRDSGARIERLVHPAMIEDQLGLERSFQGSADSSMRIALLAPLSA